MVRICLEKIMKQHTQATNIKQIIAATLFIGSLPQVGSDFYLPSLPAIAQGLQVSEHSAN